MIRDHGGHDAGRHLGILPIELHLDRQLGGPVECAPIGPWRRRECRQRLAVMPPVVSDVRLNQPQERVERCLHRPALSRQIVLQRPGGPGATRFGEHNDSEATGRHDGDIGSTTEISSRMTCSGLS
jgi:hypothetical protein